MSILSPGSVGQDIEETAQERVEERLARSRRQREISRFVRPQENRLLRETWIVAALVLVLVGVAADEVVLSLVGAAVFVSGWLARLWGRLSLQSVLFEQELRQTHAFVGESVEYRVRLENRKLLPLPWVHLRILMPPVLQPSNRRLIVTDSDNDAFLDRRTSLRWYERIAWTYSIPLVARGYYRFGLARLRSGDLFGFFTRQRDEVGTVQLWVYPETVPVEAMDVPLYRPYGESKGGQPLFEDPSRLKGLRDYQGGDPLKRVDWKATARHQKLRSRVYDPSSNPQVVIALNVTTVQEPFQGYIVEIYEQAVSVAATLATAYADERFPFGLMANCSYPGVDSTIRVPAGRSDGQLLRVLEALAMVDAFTLVGMDRLLDEESRRLPLGSTVLLVTALASPKLGDALRRVRRRGHQVAVVYVGIPDPPAELGGAPVHDLREALDGISFTRVGGLSAKRADLEFQPAQEFDDEGRKVGAAPVAASSPGASSAAASAARASSARASSAKARAPAAKPDVSLRDALNKVASSKDAPPAEPGTATPPDWSRPADNGQR
ncbi:MAG: DUF58 domain-containing protein [Chloroflexi bacterium]|nr:DUF58 domain-containing protein [Chloroflexota bacterium]